jgi:mevalonate kinase
MSSFWSSGKLLLSGEYWVLHGATALAVPTLLGQRLTYTPHERPLHWTALDRHRKPWLDAAAAEDPHVASLLRAAKSLGGQVPTTGSVRTELEFDRAWGWGSSSSLTDLVAQWTGVPALDLHFATSQGSGFDVACARATSALTYRKTGPARAEWSAVAAAHWPVEHFALVYLGQKQDSQKEVRRSRREPLPAERDAISALSLAMAEAREAAHWSALIEEAEARTAEWTGLPRVQERFGGVRATLKSLGAWGGDFVLAVAEDPSAFAYFAEHGYLCMKWSDCVPPLP